MHPIIGGAGRLRTEASLPLVLVLAGALACTASGQSAAESTGSTSDGAHAAATTALAPKLDPTTIPKFVNQLQRLPKYVPIIHRDASGNVAGKEFGVTITKFTEQQLPPPFPQTLAFGYGGNTVDAFNQNPAFRITSPGPTFEQTKGVTATIHYSNQLLGDHSLAVDPTLDWANPNKFPKPTPPFLPFPPGYAQAQSPIPHVTHTHGIEVLPQFDGTPDLWFTNNGIVGPEFVSTTYSQPSSNQSAAF